MFPFACSSSDRSAFFLMLNAAHGFKPWLHDGELGCVKRVRPALHDGLKLLHSGGAMRVCCVGVGHGAALAVAAGGQVRGGEGGQVGGGEGK